MLLSSLLVCVRIGTYTVSPDDKAVQIACATHCTPQVVFHLRQTLPRQTPGWAILVAVVAGLGGATIAMLIYRPRRARS